MLSMGITLSPTDFVSVLKRPNAVLVGFVFCYVMMPGLAYALGVGAGLSPALLAGLVLVGCINGGQASNLCTFIANGNVSIKRVILNKRTIFSSLFFLSLNLRIIVMLYRCPLQSRAKYQIAWRKWYSWCGSGFRNSFKELQFRSLYLCCSLAS